MTNRTKRIRKHYWTMRVVNATGNMLKIVSIAAMAIIACMLDSEGYVFMYLLMGMLIASVMLGIGHLMSGYKGADELWHYRKLKQKHHSRIRYIS